MILRPLARAGISTKFRLGSFSPRTARMGGIPDLAMRYKSYWLILLMILMSGVMLTAQKVVLDRHSERGGTIRHPHTHLLRMAAPGGEFQRRSKNPEYRRLLVIMVDFQEEVSDDPLTTGNGKFLLDPDPNWKTTIGSPPHDRAFFEANLEALRHYYLAVSYGSYDLEYEVWPRDRQAYTLPQTMGYYNPPNASSSVFVVRIEEYFKTAFETADAIDPEIDFGSFGHFMIIHAGSDWQHDVLGNTPSDLPSFFIRVGNGKEAVVSGGSVLISTACNVPSMITQDLRSYTEGGVTFHTGYGAINSVMAHEFGHSLGMVDLYNVFNFQPMVGVFDIMDSGGTGLMVDGPNDDGSNNLVEGILPVLPGAWSRKLLFDAYYRQSGRLKDVDQIPLYQDIRVSAGSHHQDPGTIHPTILKIPLNENEYILVENRNVDPDGDGGTALNSALDGRVILYPTAELDPLNQPTYEYDYLLPSFVDPQGRAIGGGILVWHIDNDLIYNQGVIDNEGNWRSHYENNTVNVSYNRRGVKIIEADNLPDIGYDYSWFRTGTAYEYFHQNKPNLNTDGEFVNWSNQIWRPALGAETIPALRDNAGRLGFYSLSHIGHPSPNMLLRVNGGFFNSGQVFSFDNDPVVATPLINSSFSLSPELAVIGPNTINLHTYVSFPTYTWTNLMGPLDMTPLQADLPIVVSDVNGNGFKELVAVEANSIRFLEFALDALSEWSIDSPAPITSVPLFAGGYLFYLSGDYLYRYNRTVHDSIAIGLALAKCSADDELYVLSPEYLRIVSIPDFLITTTYSLPESAGRYEPVIIQTGEDRHVYYLSTGGHVYRFHSDSITKVFNHPSSASQPTQLAVFQYNDRTPALTFGIGNRIYAITIEGSLLPGYPQNIYPRIAAAYEHSYIIKQDNANLILMPVIGGYIALNASGGINARYSIMGTRPSGSSYLVWMQNSRIVYWYYCDQDGNLQVFGSGQQLENPIQWNGLRNGSTGSFIGSFQADDPPAGKNFSAFIFPNPVRSPDFRIRVLAAPRAVSLKVYDISGQLIHKQDFPPSSNNDRDLLVGVKKLAPGVYIAVVEHGGKSKRIRFARE